MANVQPLEDPLGVSSVVIETFRAKESLNIYREIRPGTAGFVS